MWFLFSLRIYISLYSSPSWNRHNGCESSFLRRHLKTISSVRERKILLGEYFDCLGDIENFSLFPVVFYNWLRKQAKFSDNSDVSFWFVSEFKKVMIRYNQSLFPNWGWALLLLLLLLLLCSANWSIRLRNQVHVLQT